MPLGKGIRYRMVKRGKKMIRLAFRGKTVIEAKNMETGAIHSPSEFAQDRKKRKAKRKRRY